MQNAVLAVHTFVLCTSFFFSVFLFSHTRVLCYFWRCQYRCCLLQLRLLLCVAIFSPVARVNNSQPGVTHGSKFSLFAFYIRTLMGTGGDNSFTLPILHTNGFGQWENMVSYQFYIVVCLCLCSLCYIVRPLLVYGCSLFPG